MGKKHKSHAAQAMLEENGSIQAQEKIILQRARNEAAIRLLEEWLADESGYDEKNWPLVKTVIEENRLSDRRRFSE